MFVFDTAKSLANLRKHGIRFVDCEAVLLDPEGLTLEDWSEGEQRFNTLGMDATGSLVIVTWMERGDEARIISARKASAGEAKPYGTRT